MSIVPFIQAEKEKNNGKSNQVKDFSVFDFNYIPDEPIMREECQHLVREMMRFEMSGIPTHQAIIGSKGSGKTLTMKYLQKAIVEHTNLNVIYANCREHNNSFKIFAHLLDTQARGSSLSELYSKFCQRFTGKTLVILDEIDLMSSKDRRRDILYFLSRSEIPYMVIMLSNNYNVLDEIDQPTKSSLQPISVYFKNYDAPQIQEILLQRAKAGLHSWDAAKISKIAFKSCIRIVYVADKEIFAKDRGITGVLGAFNAFQSMGLNNFEVSSVSRVYGKNWKGSKILDAQKQEVVNAYKKRAFKWRARVGVPKIIFKIKKFLTLPERSIKKSILNTEELATVYHFPVNMIKASLIKKTSSKRAEPPLGLPVK